MPRAVHQIVPSFRSGDAVGNTATLTRDALRRLGFTSEIFRESCSADVCDESRPITEYVEHSSPETLLLYHYSIGAEISRFVHSLTDRLVLIYHNITPPEFFIDIHNHVVGELYHGRKQLAAFADRALLAVSESAYNRKELQEMGFRKTMPLPLAIDFESLNEKPDPILMDAFNDEKQNILFIGRIVPSKGLEDLILLYAHYKKYVSHDCRLIIAGDWSGFQRYRMQLLKSIQSIDLPHVVMPGRVDFRQLLALYTVADAYVSLSRHEGFCVPLLEAMHFQLPVMARAVAAVPETLDGSGVLVEKLNFAEMAEMLDIMLSPGLFRDRLIEGQNQRLQRYQDQPFEQHLERILTAADRAAADTKP